MKKLGPKEKVAYQKFQKIMQDDYRKAENDAYWARYYEQRIEEEKERRAAKGSWWRRFLWSLKYGSDRC